MARVIGTHGKVVNFQVLGISAVMARLEAAKIKVYTGADEGVVKAGAYVEEELKESIAGNKSEPQSVDTGHFVGDVKFNKTGYAIGKVHTPDTPYAIYVEHSTRISGGPRRHFGNTKKRTAGDVKKIIEKQVEGIM